MIATRILQLEDGTAREYRGNYDAYRSAYLRELAAQAEAYNRYREEVARLRDFAHRQLARATEIEAGPKALAAKASLHLAGTIRPSGLPAALSRPLHEVDEVPKR